jgi:threonine aldolase
MESAVQLARQAGAAVHLDGARLFNAALAAGVEPAAVAVGVDTVSFCFSKGLGAPVGSVICGSEALIDQARWVRKRLGGGMRQVGVLAAAARIALSEWRRLEEDHELASYLAAGLQEHLGDAVVVPVDSNMVFVSESDMTVGDLMSAWSAAGIKTGLIADDMIRLVCHRDVDKADADRVIGVVAGLS